MFELTKKQFVNEIIHKVIKCLNGQNSRWSGNNIYLDVVSEEGRFSKDQEYLKSILCSDKPLFIGRLGAVELVAYLNYLQINNRLPIEEKFNLLDYYRDKVLPNWWSVGSHRSMCNNAGFFPANISELNRWGKLMDEDIKKVDVLLRWLKNEKFVLDMNKEMNFLAYRNCEYPFLFKNPYIECFNGKKILVVSPFSESIKYQYNNIDKIWNDEKMRPKYQLLTVQSYNVLGGNVGNRCIGDWFDALEKMKESISLLDFDIALIGCGAYAFHLAAYVKTIGKKAITTCGSTQLLYGIYGNRWEKFLIDYKLMNDYWVRPFDSKPIGYEKVENAAYW